MKYEDYKVEEMMFTNKTDWTEDEMREVLDTFPESRNWRDKLDALEQLNKDIEDGVVKKNRYEELNGISLKAYAKKHWLFKYENVYSICSSYNRMRIMIDGTEREIKHSYDVNDLINLCQDVQKRFYNVSLIYKKKEDTWFKNDTESKYEETNKDRINANRKAKAWLDNTRIYITTGIEKCSDGYYITNGHYPEKFNLTLRFDGDNYAWHNKYGELTFSGEVVSEEDAKRISSICEDMSKRIEPIIRRYSSEMETLKLKYCDIAQQKKEATENDNNKEV